MDLNTFKIFLPIFIFKSVYIGDFLEIVSNADLKSTKQQNRRALLTQLKIHTAAKWACVRRSGVGLY